jgi:DNA invertase Pin-like site-specific DNA recombinase
MGTVYNFSQEQIQDIIDMYTSNISTTDIMRKYDMRNTAIYRLLRKYNIPLHGHKDRKTLSADEVEDLVLWYQEGVKQQEIAKRLGVSVYIVRQLLKNNSQSGYARKSGNKFITLCNFASDDVENMIEQYQSGISAEQIGRQYGVSDDTIIKKLREHNIEIRSRSYRLNENYFDAIDNQDKAYILGLLYADGCNNTQIKSIILSLQEEDMHILQQIRDVLDSEQPLRFIDRNSKNEKWKNSYSLEVHSRHMSETLERCGVVKAKSLILTFPDWLDPSLYSHFIRGYFDGDGHISKQEHKYNMSIVGTESFCKKIQDILRTEIGIESRLHISTSLDKPTRTLMVTKRDDNQKFFDYIYRDANLYLHRKYDVYRNKYCENYWNKELLV